MPDGSPDEVAVVVEHEGDGIAASGVEGFESVSEGCETPGGLYVWGRFHAEGTADYGGGVGFACRVGRQRLRRLCGHHAAGKAPLGKCEVFHTVKDGPARGLGFTRGFVFGDASEAIVQNPPGFRELGGEVRCGFGAH